MSNTELDQPQCIWCFLGSFENATRTFSGIIQRTILYFTFNRNKWVFSESKDNLILEDIVPPLELNLTNIFKFCLIYFFRVDIFLIYILVLLWILTVN